MTKTFDGDAAPAGEARHLTQPNHPALQRMAGLQTFVVVTVVGVALLYLFSDVLLLLFAGVLLACQLTGVAQVLHRRVKLPYALALAAVVLGITALIALFVYLLGPRVVREAREVYGDISGQLAALLEKHGGHPDWVDRLAGRIKGYLDKKDGSLAGEAAGFVSTTIGNLGSVALIVVAAIYLSISPSTYRIGSLRLLPERLRPRGGEIMLAEMHTLRRWFVGQLLDMLVVGAMTMLGLYLLGIPLWFTLGCIAGLANFVPYLGALAGSIPAIIVALGQSPTEAVYVVALVAVVQTIEGNVTSPLISKRTVDLPPVLTLFSQTVLGSLFGLFGLIFATPIVAAGLVLVRTLYVHDYLGDKSEQTTSA